MGLRKGVWEDLVIATKMVCGACRIHDHTNCEDELINAHAFDAEEFVPPVCDCNCEEEQELLDRVYDGLI